MEEKQVQKPHKLVVNNRKTSMVTGVLDVLSFDLNEILLETEQGMLMVKGEGSACKSSECRKRGSGLIRTYRQHCVLGCPSKCRSKREFLYEII